MAKYDRPAEAGGGGSTSLGSSVSRARLAVSQNQKSIAEQARNAKNAEIKTKAQEILKSKQGTQAGHAVTSGKSTTKPVK